MTEAEWLACDDPTLMLEVIAGNVTERRMRLFGCACCRRLWPYLTDLRSRRAVEVMERAADGDENPDELKLVSDDACDASIQALDKAQEITGPAQDERDRKSRELRSAFRAAYDEETTSDDAPEWLALKAQTKALWGTCEAICNDAKRYDHAASAASALSGMANSGDEFPTTAEYVDFLCVVGRSLARNCSNAGSPDEVVATMRDIFGNPFRTVAVESSWLSSTVEQVAQAIYTERAFDRLPILADALEDAGCADRDILDHCRGPGPHVRGCWVVDLVLGKS